MKTFSVTFVTLLLSVPTLVMADDAETQQRNREALLECLKQEDTSQCWADGQVLNHGVKVPRERIQAVLEDIRRTFPDGAYIGTSCAMARSSSTTRCGMI
jgi:hypothetical protein